MLATQNLAYNRPPPLLTHSTQHTTSTHPAPSPTHYHTPSATQYLTTHQTTVLLYPSSPTTPCYPLYNQPILNPYSIPSSSSNICTRTPNTLSNFSPLRHPTSIPHSSIPRMGTSERHKGAQLRMTIIFLGGK